MIIEIVEILKLYFPKSRSNLGLDFNNISNFFKNIIGILDNI